MMDEPERDPDRGAVGGFEHVAGARRQHDRAAGGAERGSVVEYAPHGGIGSGDLVGTEQRRCHDRDIVIGGRGVGDDATSDLVISRRAPQVGRRHQERRGRRSGDQCEQQRPIAPRHQQPRDHGAPVARPIGHVEALACRSSTRARTPVSCSA